MSSILEGLSLRMGGLEWQCLAVVADRALYITKDIVEMRAYHAPGGDITWEYCTLRQYLNGKFLRRFSPQEQTAIVETTLANDNNPQYNTYGGNATKDKVFLLSVAEANTYFGSASERAAKFNNDGYRWKLRPPGNNQDAAAFVDWWLRSPGNDQDAAAFVDYHGFVTLCGSSVNYGSACGVRPALWLRL